MADREWAFTGVSDVSEGISSVAREHLHTIVMSQAISNSTISGFLDDIDFAVGVYCGNTVTHEQSLPSNTRRNLKAAFNAALAVNERLNEFDGTSMQIIGEIDPSGLTDIRQSLGTTIQLLNRAHNRSKAFNTNGGRKMETHFALGDRFVLPINDAALRFLKKAMKRYGRPEVIVTDRLRSYRAAMREIGNEARQETGRWLNNRAENSHQPFRRRERAMARFRSFKSLQKFASIHTSVHNHFNQDRHLNSRQVFKLHRSAALAEWWQLAA